MTMAQRNITVLRSGWAFSKGEHPQAAHPSFDDSDWQRLDVPHDWAIGEPFIEDGHGDTGKLPWKAEGWYRLTLPASTQQKGKRFYLLFDGVMAFPKVFVNGQLAGSWDYGYNSFYLDITDLLKQNEANLLAIHADTRQHDSRWYPGGGIYRKVSLIELNPVHVAIWGTQITTPIIRPHYAEVRMATTVQNSRQEAASVRVQHRFYTAAGQLVHENEETLSLPPAGSFTQEINFQLTNPQLWDIDAPHLYRVETRIFDGQQASDLHESSFGVRSIAFTANDGFHLNNRRVQLKGVNLHSDFGPLGVAFNARAMERQLEIMKSMGVNAIRNSHNTAAPELLDLCDRMGLLFFNEVFDKYDAKADITPQTDFEEFAHRNIRNFVMRDRNHPCVFIWSVGNEIKDVQWNENRGFHRLHTMLNYVNKYDPTRPVTLVCDSKESAEKRHFELYDVHSWNYGRRYSLARQLEPDKSVIISESASTLSTRGFYELPLPEKATDFTKSLQVSSYDLHAPEWAELADDDFMWQQDEPYVAGEFVWTGIDYLGEPTPYNNTWAKENGLTDKAAARSSYFGAVDLVGIPKDRYYLYKSYWKPEETTVHILPHWNWEERKGQNVPVFVYTNADCAELFLNGKSLGKRCKNPVAKNSTERFRLMWKEVTYQPGELKAVAYRNGKVIGEKVMKTAGKPAEIRLSPDRSILKANGEDLSFILVEAYDKDGNLCPLAHDMVTFEVKGKAKIAGVGNGNPQSFHPFQSANVPLFYGKAMLILQGENSAGSIEVKATAKGLKTGQTTITVE